MEQPTGFDVPNVTAAAPQTDCSASWSACTPDSVNGFSCVGWLIGAPEAFPTLNALAPASSRPRCAKPVDAGVPC